MNRSKLQLCLNTLIITLMLFQSLVFPLQVWAEELRNPTPPPVEAPKWSITPAQAEGNLMYTLNVLLNLPLDASPEMIELANKNLEIAAEIYEQALTQQAATPAGVPAPAKEDEPSQPDQTAAPSAGPSLTQSSAAEAGPNDPNEVYMLSANKEMEDGRLASWVITGDPGDDPEAFDRNFSRMLDIDGIDGEDALPAAPQTAAGADDPSDLPTASQTELPLDSAPPPENYVPPSAPPAVPPSVPPAAPLSQLSNVLIFCDDVDLGGNCEELEDGEVDPAWDIPLNPLYLGYKFPDISTVGNGTVGLNTLASFDIAQGYCVEFFTDQNFQSSDISAPFPQGELSAHICGPATVNDIATDSRIEKTGAVSPFIDNIESMRIYQDNCYTPTPDDVITRYTTPDFGLGYPDPSVEWSPPCAFVPFAEASPQGYVVFESLKVGRNVGVLAYESGWYSGVEWVFNDGRFTHYKQVPPPFDTALNFGSGPVSGFWSHKIGQATDLSVFVYPPPGPISPGNEFTVGYRIENTSPTTTTVGGNEPEAYVSVTGMPLGMDVITPTTTPTSTLKWCSRVGDPDNHYLSCHLNAPLANDDFVEGTLTFTTTTALSPGTRTLQFRARGKWEKVEGDENSQDFDITTRNEADLSVSLSAPAAVQKSRSSTTYVVQAAVTNNGPDDSQASRVVFTPPSGTSPGSPSPSQGSCSSNTTCDLGLIANGGSVTVDYLVNVPSTFAEGATMAGEATVSITDPGAQDPDESNNTASSNSSTLTHWVTNIGASGPGGEVHDLVYQSGVLYAAGVFGVKRWTGSAWSSIGGPSGTVYTLIPDGSGGLYAGGSFTNIGPRLARWNGSSWSAVGGGVPNGTVYALATGGSDLYVGGQFTQAGSLTTNNIARWDGATWHPLGVAGVTQGLGGSNPPHVRAIAVNGNDVYVGGLFMVPAIHIAKWNKTDDAWTSLGTGMGYMGGSTVVHAMAMLNNRLYVGGRFANAGNVSSGVNNIAGWDLARQTWTTLGGGLGGGLDSVNDLSVMNGQLLAAGKFSTAGGVSVKHAALWNGATWFGMGQGIASESKAVVSDNSDDTFVGGAFSSVDNTLVTANNVGQYRHFDLRDISISQSITPDPPTAGQSLSINLNVTNNSGSTAPDVMARYELPAGISFVSASGCTHADGIVTCNLGNMSGGSSQNKTIQTSVSTLAEGTMTSQAWAGARRLDSNGSNNFAGLTRAIVSEADLEVTLSGPGTATAGENITYNLGVTNNGPAVATAAVVTLTLPTGGANLASASGLSCVAVSDYDDFVEVRCNLGDMAPSASDSGTLTFNIRPETLGTMGASANATSLLSDPTPVNNTPSVNTTIQDAADLSGSISAPALVFQPISGLSEFSYNLGVANAGPSLARNATIDLTLPADVTFDAASAGCTLQGDTVTCAAGNLATGESAGFVVDVFVNYGTPHATSLDAYVLAASASNDLQPFNNTDSTSTVVSTDTNDQQADLQLSQATDVPVNAGETLVYWMNVYNAGAVEAGFTLTDTLPAGVTFDRSLSDPTCDEPVASPGVVVCQLPALGSGMQRQVDIAVTVPADTPAGTTLNNAAEVSSNITDSNPADNQAGLDRTVSTLADLRLTMDSSHTTVAAGETVSYLLTVKNLGPSLAQGVIVSDPPPAGLVLQSATPSQGSCDTAGGIAACNLGNLAVQTEATVQIIMTAGSGTVTNQATAGATTPDSNVTNNTASATLEIAGASRTTRTFGAVNITADTFVDLPGGATQAFGNVWLGDYLRLAGETDSMVIDGQSVTGEGTIEYLQEQIQLFTGDFSGSFAAASATLAPAANVLYQLDEMAGFPLNNRTITQIDLLAGRSDVQTTAFWIKAPGFDKTLAASIFVDPGPVYGGTVGDFSFVVSDITFDVQNAELLTEGVSANNVTITLPGKWGGVSGSVSELVITEYGVSIGGASMTVPLPDMNLAGEKVKLINNEITIIYNGQDLMLIGDGTLAINLPDNEQESAISFMIDSNGDFMASIDQITLYMATLSLELTDVMVNNDGLYVDTGVLTLPPSLNESTVTVREVSVTADGLEVGGGAVTVNLPDIVMGSQVRFSGVSVTMEITNGNEYSFSVDAVLQLRLPQNDQDITINAAIDNDGNFAGTLDLITLKLGPATLTLTNIAFDKTGLQVDDGTLLFPQNLGGVSATLTEIIIDENGLSFGGGAVQVPIPDVQVGGFSISEASLTIEFAIDRTYKFIIAGTMNIKVAEFDAMAMGNVTIDQHGNTKGEVTGFSVGVAGMELIIEDCKIRDGVITASVAGLKVPNAWGGAEVTVYNIRISKDEIKIGGGKFVLPEIKAGGVSLGSLWGELREEGDGYIIVAGGKFNAGVGGPNCMLNVEVTLYYGPDGSPAVEFKSVNPPPPASEQPETGLPLAPVSTQPQQLAQAGDISAQADSLRLREVSVGLDGCRIPISSTGFYLVAVQGTITFEAPGEMPKLQIDVTVEDTGKMVTIDAGMGMEFDPWKMDFWGTVTLFSLFEAAKADGTVRSGFFTLHVEDKFGRSGDITAWSDDGFHMIGRLQWKVNIPKGSVFEGCINLGVDEICISVPPSNLSFNIGAEFGEFKNGAGTVWGIKGWVTVMGYTAGFYIDTTGKLAIGNVDKYQLITPPSVMQAKVLHEAMRAEEEGLSTLSAANRQLLDIIVFAAEDVIINQLVDVSTDVGFVMSRKGSAPTMTLIDPDGRAIAPGNLPGNVFFDESTLDDGSIQTLYMVNGAQAGQWQVVLHNVPADEATYVFQAFGANPPPALADVSVMSTGSDTAQVNWQLTSAEITTTLDLHITEGPIVVTQTYTDSNGQPQTTEETLFTGQTIIEDVVTTLDGSPSQVDLDLSDVASGEYWLWFNAEDGRNPPTRVYAPNPIYVSHSWSNTWTSNIMATPGFRNLDVAWSKHPNPDVDIYKIEVGRLPGLVDEVAYVGPGQEWPLDNLTADQVYYLTVIGVDEETGRISRGETITAIPDGGTFDLTVDTGSNLLGAMFVPENSIGIMSGTADLTVTAGQTVTLNLKLSSTVDPYPAAVGLYSGDIVDGIYVNFLTAEMMVVPTVAGTLIPVEISVSPTMVGGVYDVPIQAFGEGLQDEVTVHLTVNEPRVEVSALPDQVSLTTNGGATSATLNAVSLFGGTRPVELDLDNAPTGLEYSISPNTLSAGSSATLSLTDTSRLSNGVYPLSLRSEAGLQQQLVPITLTVQKPDFTLSPNLTFMSMLVGEKAVFAIPTAGENLTGPVAFSLEATSSQVPDGQAGFAASPTKTPQATFALTPPGTAYLIMETADTTPVGRYHLKVQAQIDGKTVTKSFYVTVLAEATTADVGVTQTSAANTVAVGGVMTYTIQVVNYGPLKATNIVLTDTLPAQTSLVSATPGRGSCQDNGLTVTCDLYDLRRGDSVDVTIVGRVSSAVERQTELVNQVAVAADQPDNVPVNNSNLVSVIATTQSDLTLSISGSPDPVIAGAGEMTYVIMARNNGPSDAPEVEMNLTLPEDVTLLTMPDECGASVDQTKVLCNLGKLTANAPNNQAIVYVTVQVDSGATGLLTAEAVVDSADSNLVDPIVSNNNISVETQVETDVNLMVTHQMVAPEEAIAGAELAYQLVISNTGQSDARNVQVYDTLPDEYSTVTSAVPTQGSCTVVGKQVTCQLGTVKPQTGASITLRGVVNAGSRTPLYNSSTVQSASAETVTNDNHSYALTSLTARTDLEITANSARPSSYQFLVDNKGPSEARGVVLKGTLSEGLGIEQFIPSQGTCLASGQEFTCQLGTISPLDRVVVNVITSLADGYVRGIASGEISGSETDMLLTNNNSKVTSWLEGAGESGIYLPIIFRGGTMAPSGSSSSIKSTPGVLTGGPAIYLPIILNQSK
ncbi:MAG: DUF11 domain-containing protein [Chloroflexi bacterium]|nr:DUF11 domain-containing protein [Chloroflexota bacterium]